MMVVKQQWWWVLDPHIIALLSETESNEQRALVFGAGPFGRNCCLELKIVALQQKVEKRRGLRRRHEWAHKTREKDRYPPPATIVRSVGLCPEATRLSK